MTLIPQLFVSGTWKESKAEPWTSEARLLGQIVAEAGFDLSCGPGTGIARHVIDGYQGVSPRGIVRYYLPLLSEMQAVGEVVAPGYDEIIQTDFDYPMRNVFQISRSSGVFVLTGGDGTLEEVLPALIDYDLPVAVLENSGSAYHGLKALVEIYPDWLANLLFGSDVTQLATELFSRMELSAARTD